MIIRPGKPSKDVKKGNLQQVIELNKAELAQKVATLQLQLTEKEDVIESLKITVAKLQAEHAKSKSEYESTVLRHQQFIDKVNINYFEQILLYVWLLFLCYIVIKREKRTQRKLYFDR